MSARHGPEVAKVRSSNGSCRATQGDDWQVLAPFDEADVQPQADATFPLDGRLRVRTGRPARPPGTWFVPRFAIGWLAAEVHFVGSFAAQGHVRTGRVKPIAEQGELTFQFSPGERDDDSAAKFGLECENEPLRDRDRTMPAHGAVTRLDASAATPAAIAIAIELLSLVGDDSLWVGLGLALHACEESADVLERRLFGKARDAQYPAAEMVHDHHYPMAERPGKGD